MSFLPAQNLVFSGDVLIATIRYVSGPEMLSCLAGHFYLVDFPESMIQFLSVGFVPALYQSATGRESTVLRWHPLHIRSDGQQIVSPVVVSFDPAVCDAT